MSDNFEKHFVRVDEDTIKNIPFGNFFYNLFNVLHEIADSIRDLKRSPKPTGILQYRLDISSDEKLIDNHLFTAPTDYEIIGMGCSYVASSFSTPKDKIKIRLNDYTVNNIISQEDMELSTFRKSFKLDKKIGNITVGHTVGIQIETEVPIKPFSFDIFLSVRERD